MSHPEPAINAERVRLSAGDRRVFEALSFEVPPGTLAAVVGASGTGKTSLLLTLAGRMRGWHGALHVCGIDAAHESAHVRRLVGLGLVCGVNDLAEALTPAQHVAEQRVFVPRSKRSERKDVLADVGLDAAARVPVRRLDAEQRIRLGIALALVCDIRVLVVDDLDRDLDAEQRARALRLLHTLADGELTVVFACLDRSTADSADVAIAIDGAEPSPSLSEQVSVHAVA